MKLHLIVDVTPDDGERPAHSEVLLEVLEEELERGALEVDGRTYAVKVIGSGKGAREALESARMRRQH
jgi:hypothetical protein